MPSFKKYALLFFIFCSSYLWANSSPLTIYTYESFSAPWGSAPELTRLFKKEVPQCQLNFISFEDGVTLFNRLRLEGKHTKAHIVIGLDQHLLQEARNSQLFIPHHIDLSSLHLPFLWTDRTFLPYDYAQYAFIYDKNRLTTPPNSLNELLERQDLSIIYQDPRTSTVGRGLLIWINAVFNTPQAIQQAWQHLAKHTLMVGKSWGETYGAFLKGEADLVLSYNTSPLYHKLEEQKDNYIATTFKEGAIIQIELAALVRQNPHPCSESFLQFLLTPQAQTIIAKRNVMLPVINIDIAPHYTEIIKQHSQMPILNTETISPQKMKEWINVWLQALVK